jgi:glycerate-2-kinase
MPPNTDFALLTYSSDGIDGPTSAAGAIVTSAMLANAASTTRTQLDAALTNHDSHTALANLNALITTGPTGTNVNHIAVLLWQRPT